MLYGPIGNFGEALLELSEVLPHGKGELGILAGELAGAPVAVCDSNRPQLLRALDGNGAQADGVNELEDGGVGADSERKSEDGDEGKAGTEAKKPQSMAKIAPERGHSIPLAVSDDGQDRMSRGVSTANPLYLLLLILSYPRLRGEPEVVRLLPRSRLSSLTLLEFSWSSSHPTTRAT